MGFLSVLLLVILVISTCMYCIYHLDMEWRKVDEIGVITSSRLPEYVTDSSLLIMRLIFGGIVWASCSYLYLDREGLRLTIPDRQNRLKEVHIIGLARFTAFTVWCWTLQGWYFGGVAILSIDSLRNMLSSAQVTILTRATWILFEISFAMAFLVSIVVTYVLIPAAIRAKVPLGSFFRPMPLLFHNANVIFMVADLMVNKIPFCKLHFLFVLLYGIAYVVFSWYWFHVKGIFYYFFLDYENKFAILWHIGLLVAVSLFFFFGYILDSWRDENTLYFYPVAVVACVMSLKFKK